MSEESAWRQLGRTLVTLEINTIITASITSEKMPPLPHALLDIAQEYGGALLDMDVAILAWLLHPTYRDALADPAAVRIVRDRIRDRATPEASLEDRRDVSQQVRPNVAMFRAIRAAARRRQFGFARPPDPAVPEPDDAGPLPLPDPTSRALLNRMINNAEAIIAALGRDTQLAAECQLTRTQMQAQRVFGPYEHPDDTLAIAKFWEIGTEEVQSQTVISLTGDVTTRVIPRLTRPEAGPVVALHRQQVDVALSCWKSLAEAAMSLIQLVFGGGRR